MLSFVRETRSALVSAAAEDPTLSLGPSSPTGWTAVQIESPDGMPSGAPALLVDQLDDEVELTVRDAAGEEHLVWSIDPEEPVGPSRDNLDRMIEALGRLLNLSASDRTAVAALLADRPDGEALVGALGEAVGLPDLALPAPRSAVVLARFPRAGMRATGMMAATHLGRVTFAELVAGWTCLVPEEEPEAADALAMAVGQAMRAGNIVVRRRRALLLWRGDRGVCGALVVRGGEVEASMSWGSAWDEPALDGWGARDAIVDEFVQLADPAAVDLHGLRALFRSSSHTDDPLTALVARLGLPPGAIAVLDGTEGAPSRAELPPIGFWQYLWALLNGRGSLADGDPTWQVVLGALAVLVAVVCALMSALSVAVLATDGAFIDQAGTTSEDWWALLLFLALTLMHVVAARGAFRSARRVP